MGLLTMATTLAGGTIALLIPAAFAATVGRPESGSEVAGLGLFAGTYALLIVAFGATVSSFERTTAPAPPEQVAAQ
jgi:hypothetical protein